MDLERIIGSIVTENGPQPFVLHTQNGQLEVGWYTEPDEAQANLTITQRQRFVQLIAERADVTFAKVRLGQFYDVKNDQWVDVLHEEWSGPIDRPRSATPTPKPAEVVEATPAAPVEEEELFSLDGEFELEPAESVDEAEPEGAAEAVVVEDMALDEETFIDAVLLPNEAVMLEKAIRIAVEAHGGQLDKAGDLYILHPLRMMLQMQAPTEMMAAVLHDIVEDTGWTLEALRHEGFSEAVVEAVDGLTRRQGESYDAFIERAAHHGIARRVKLADLEDNMDIRRLDTLTEKDQARLVRYLKAWRRLRDVEF